MLGPCSFGSTTTLHPPLFALSSSLVLSALPLGSSLIQSCASSPVELYRAVLDPLQQYNNCTSSHISRIITGHTAASSARGIQHYLILHTCHGISELDRLSRSLHITTTKTSLLIHELFHIQHWLLETYDGLARPLAAAICDSWQPTSHDEWHERYVNVNHQVTFSTLTTTRTPCFKHRIQIPVLLTPRLNRSTRTPLPSPDVRSSSPYATSFSSAIPSLSTAITSQPNAIASLNLRHKSSSTSPVDAAVEPSEEAG